MGKSQDLYVKAKKLIPGGTQLLSKRPEMFLPGQWPAYYKKAKGCKIWDLDGNKFTDMSYMGIGACILGYAYNKVDKAVKSAIDKGSMSTLNCPEEVELAKLLCKIHPWAEMARYARTGGEAMAIAARIARAKTGKDLILFCGYHGWHDWYLSANMASNRALDGHLLPGLSPKGVPRTMKKTAIPFEYNDKEGFLRLADRHDGKIAAIVMEPIRNRFPSNGFLQAVKKTAKKSGAVLVFDEITSGFRLNSGGAHLKLGVNPDIAVLGKAMSNGYPMAAIIGKKNAMDIAQETFISSTYWTERIGPTAALATISELKAKKVPRHLIKTGREIQKGWKQAAEKNGVCVEVSGIPPLAHFSFCHKNHLVLKTLFTQLMLEKGFLATNSFYASYAHSEGNVSSYLSAVEKSFAFMGKAMRKGNPKEFLKGPVCHPGFKRLA